jgi:hypothetical protein
VFLLAERPKALTGSLPRRHSSLCGACVVTARDDAATRTEIPMKLADTQLVLLSAASQREDGAIELAPSLRGAASHKVVHKLLSNGLIEEVAAGGVLPVWRRDEEKGALALRITSNGLAAIQVDEAPVEGNNTSQAAVASGPPARRHDKAAVTNTHKPSRSAKPKRTGTKQDRVIAMLSRPQGATIAAIMKVTGWQPHSVRGFLAAVVCKRLDLKLHSEKSGKERVYRISGKAARSKRKPARRNP